MRRTISLLFAAAAIPALVTVAAPPAKAIESSLSAYEPGTIVVRTGERRLYLILGNGQTRSYTVGVGMAGKTWTGTSYVSGKYLKPAWSPPADVRRDKPHLPNVIPGGSRSNITTTS